VETFLLLHFTLIFEKILLVCLVSRTPQKGRCFNMLALWHEAEKGYGGKWQV